MRGLFGDLEGGSAVTDSIFPQHAPNTSGERADPGLAAGALARRLGVATTTLRTWHQRYGLGPSGHQAGRHRRYTPHDVAALTEMARLTTRGVPAAEAARQARRQTTPWPADHPALDRGTEAAARRIARAARRLDVLTLRETLTAAVASQGVVHTWHALAGPAFVHISQAGYGEPHKAVARRVLGRCLSEVFAAVPRPPAGSAAPVMLVAVDTRRDVAALDALAAALAERGVGSVHLGADLPPGALTDVAGQIRPTVVVVWSHSWREDISQLIAALSTVPQWQPVIVTAGGAWPVGHGVLCPTLADTVAAVAGLIDGP
ncbi:MerR family transcriptional regulator [Paractinoplanes ferrugineus]|uniref:Transcriptional regulator n=1 Tax=Paractinoplanes ferrugineus TaxID=113564 RepID=A0A919MPU2_9ACTN|nr:MerR family transcriptional regulator [Actinoplanes ferrugineus]GIE15647.1 transcriptional regulator [Actinoplanes ferrugineus]